MSTRSDGRARDRRITIPAQRLAPDVERVMADDRLIEDVRLGRVTRDSPRIARMLAQCRRSVLACSE